MFSIVTRKHLAKIIDQILLIGSIILIGIMCWNFLNTQKFEALYDELYTLLWVTFLFEFLIKISLAKHKFDFILSNILVVFIILFPFLRVLSLFPISRWSIVILIEQVNARLPLFRKYRVLEIFLISTVLIILSADIFLRIETTDDSLFHSFGDAIWFTIVTVATVGYGDIYPKTFYGRVLASFLIIFGISIFGIITASISSYLVEQDS